MPGMDLSQIIIQIEEDRIVAYCNFASLIVLVYDYFLTLGRETVLVWDTPWSLGKILYFATRYSPFIDSTLLVSLSFFPSSVSPAFCSKLYATVAWMLIAGVFIAELVLVFRTWAIWGQNSKLAIALLAVLVTLGIPVCLFAYFGLKAVRFTSSPVPQGGCWLEHGVNPISFAAFLLLFLFESVILVLTVVKGRQHLRHSHARLFVTLYRDGVLYYFFLVLCTLANIVVAGKSINPGPSLQLMQRVMHTIVTSRILLNLRQAITVDRAKRRASSRDDGEAEDDDEAPDRTMTRTALSSVIIGVDTWFRDGADDVEVEPAGPAVPSDFGGGGAVALTRCGSAGV